MIQYISGSGSCIGSKDGKTILGNWENKEDIFIHGDNLSKTSSKATNKIRLLNLNFKVANGKMTFSVFIHNSYWDLPRAEGDSNENGKTHNSNSYTIKDKNSIKLFIGDIFKNKPTKMNLLEFFIF